MEMCYNTYRRIKDRVMWISNSAMLNFVVDLYTMKKNPETNSKVGENFHKEYGYIDKDSGELKILIKREFYYYFEIEQIIRDSKNYSKGSIKVHITQEYIYGFLMNFKKVLEWFSNSEGKSIFYKHNDSYVIPVRPETIRITLAFDNVIEIDAATAKNRDGIPMVGIAMSINDAEPFFMDSNCMYGLYNMLSTCNMYALAQEMLSYIGRPEFGTNYTPIGQAAVQQKPVSKTFFGRTGATEKKQD